MATEACSQGGRTRDSFFKVPTMTHTPGKLTVSASNATIRGEDECIVAAVGSGVQAVHSRSGEESAANARRLAACWNAFDGVSTENIESGPTVLQLADWILASKAIRLELIAACEAALTKFAEYYPARTGNMPEAVRLCEAAVARGKRVDQKGGAPSSSP
jgi:hypothetical protein